jgi:hypothetical protein
MDRVKGDEMERLHTHLRQRLHNIRVVLNYRPLGIVQAITEEIAHDHILVNTGAITLQHNAEVEIMMSLPGIKHNQQHHISAKVSHCDESGHSTLSFSSCGRKTLRALLPYLTRH